MKALSMMAILIAASEMQAQTHEIHGGIGFAQYYGDLNVVNSGGSPIAVITDGINPKNYKMSYSLGYRYNLKEFFSVGASLNHLYICGYDSDNTSKQEYDAAFYRTVRNLSFYSTVNQLRFDFRYEPLRSAKRWKTPNWFLSPYIGAGFGIFSFNPKTMYNGNEVELQPLGTEGQGNGSNSSKYSLVQISLPLSLGFKLNTPNRKFALGLDFTYCYTATDYLDDVSTVYADPSTFSGSGESNNLAANLANRNLYGLNHLNYSSITNPGEQRGNNKNNDGFLTGQITFSYYLGKPSLSQVACSSF
jgi:hypothetical protein